MKASGFRAHLRELKSLTPKERQAIFARDNYTCQTPFCGRKVGLEVHHIRGENVDLLKADYNHPFNLLTVCSECHRGYSMNEINYPILYRAFVMPTLLNIAAQNSKPKLEVPNQ